MGTHQHEWSGSYAHSAYASADAKKLYFHFNYPSSETAHSLQATLLDGTKIAYGDTISENYPSQGALDCF